MVQLPWRRVQQLSTHMQPAGGRAQEHAHTACAVRYATCVEVRVVLKLFHCCDNSINGRAPCLQHCLSCSQRCLQAQPRIVQPGTVGGVYDACAAMDGKGPALLLLLPILCE